LTNSRAAADALQGDCFFSEEGMARMPISPVVCALEGSGDRISAGLYFLD
jgi:hypothetical protein